MDNLQHPDITAAERTGYPRGYTEPETEPETKKPGIRDLYEDTMAAFEAVDMIMKNNAADMTELLDATVLEIRDYGIHIQEPDFVLGLPGARVEPRDSAFYPYEVIAEIDGVRVFALMEEAPDESAV